jgi:Cu/Ag efflux protein CusF
MTRLLLTAVLAAVWTSASFAQARPTPPASASSAAEMTLGEIRKVDKEAKKLTIRHGEIKNLDMPPMTMVFQVRDPALLDKFKAGDKVRFSAEQTTAGFVVIDIRNLP